jgi:hypothetical protein
MYIKIRSAKSATSKSHRRSFPFVPHLTSPHHHTNQTSQKIFARTCSIILFIDHRILLTAIGMTTRTEQLKLHGLSKPQVFQLLLSVILSDERLKEKATRDGILTLRGAELGLSNDNSQDISQDAGHEPQSTGTSTGQQDEPLAAICQTPSASSLRQLPGAVQDSSEIISRYPHPGNHTLVTGHTNDDSRVFASHDTQCFRIPQLRH